MAVAVLILRRVLPSAELRSALAFFFVTTLAAGLEPATARAWALRSPGPVPAAPLLTASAIKALAASPLIGLVWMLADPGVPLFCLASLPVIVCAGFWATDGRVLLDLDGRHAAALWLKQGSLASAYLLAAGGLAARLPIAAAILLASLPRLAPPLMIAWRARASVTANVAGLLRDAGWIAMAGASVFAALGGSLDRLVGLRLLPAQTYAGYLLLYELLSRFWVLPYLGGPVLFARLASGQESSALSRRLRTAVLLAGAAMIAVVAAGILLAHRQASALLRLPIGAAMLAFALAIVLAALTQLRIAELQGRGKVRAAAAVVGGAAALAVPLFWIAAARWGVEGLLWAWLVKAAVELGAASLVGREGRNA